MASEYENEIAVNVVPHNFSLNRIQKYSKNLLVSYTRDVCMLLDLYENGFGGILIDYGEG